MLPFLLLFFLLFLHDLYSHTKMKEKRQKPRTKPTSCNSKRSKNKKISKLEPTFCTKNSDVFTKKIKSNEKNVTLPVVGKKIESNLI